MSGPTRAPPKTNDAVLCERQRLLEDGLRVVADIIKVPALDLIL